MPGQAGIISLEQTHLNYSDLEQYVGLQLAPELKAKTLSKHANTMLRPKQKGPGRFLMSGNGSSSDLV